MINGRFTTKPGNKMAGMSTIMLLIDTIKIYRRLQYLHYNYFRY